MTLRTVSIAWPEGTVTGRLAGPAGNRGIPVLLAHGAGAGQDHRLVTELRDGIAAAGHEVLTFNYPYTEAGRKRPDPQPRLLECHRAVAQWLRERTGQEIVLAGRSMGGRMASYLVAEGDPARGLILFAYPLHPAGKPDRLRKDHLPSISVPILFVSGDRDPLARPELVDRWIRPLPTATVLDVVDGDHSFRVPKRAGRSHEEVNAAILAGVAGWLQQLSK